MSETIGVGVGIGIDIFISMFWRAFSIPIPIPAPNENQLERYFDNRLNPKNSKKDAISHGRCLFAPKTLKEAEV